MFEQIAEIETCVVSEDADGLCLSAGFDEYLFTIRWSEHAVGRRCTIGIDGYIPFHKWALVAFWLILSTCNRQFLSIDFPLRQLNYTFVAACNKHLYTAFWRSRSTLDLNLHLALQWTIYPHIKKKHMNWDAHWWPRKEASPAPRTPFRIPRLSHNCILSASRC